MLTFDPVWLAALQKRASQPPESPRAPLYAGGRQIGSFLPHLFDDLPAWVNLNKHNLLLKMEQGRTANGAAVWQVQGDLTRSINQIAAALRDAPAGHVAHGFVAKYWRGEQLGIYAPSGDLLGSIERGGVRPLGIATRAVHLVGHAPDGRVWVQQRALDKANDPGQWDTLMGGMIPVEDDLHTALARETWEEAGLHIAQLHDVALRGRVSIHKPTHHAGAAPGVGYVVEDIDWFTCTVPEGCTPVNQDGEVAKFELLALSDLRERLQQDAFTLEASMILVAALSAAESPDRTLAEPS